MHSFLRAILLAGLTVAAFPSFAADKLAEDTAATAPSFAPQSRPGSFADLAQKLLPTVVNISSTGKAPDMIQPQAPEGAPIEPGSPFEDFYENYMNRQQGGPLVENTSLGSGFIIDAEKGYVITNGHVIRDAADIRVTLHNDESYRAEVVGVDDKTDIALLKIDPQGAHLSAVKYGDSDSLRVGDWIMAIGNPFGLGGTVTAGIVSARSRDINAGPYDDFIQTDASINRGNSGGPMFNTRGELIGINTAIFSPSGGSVGIGFAIPVNMSKPVIKQLIKYGHTKRGWLGVKIQTVTPEIAEALNLEGGPRGALIANVTDKGPGDDAGMQPYDVLLTFNGHEIATMRDLPRLVAEAEIDTDIPVTVFREGKIIETTTRLGELEQAEAQGRISDLVPGQPALPPGQEPDMLQPLPDDGSDGMDQLPPVTSEEPKQAPAITKTQGLHYRSLAVVLAPITPELSKQFNLIEGMTGLVITKVDDYSDAAHKGILPGDVILEIDQGKVANSQEVLAAITAARGQKRTSVLMLVDRAGDERFVAVKLTEKPKAKPKSKADKKAR